MIEVRHADAEDGPVLGAIHAASWEAAYGAFFDPEFTARAVEDRRARWGRRIAEAKGTILVAEHLGRPLAMSYFLESSARPGFAELYSFYAHPDGWGTGVAAALMNSTLDGAADAGYASIHLWTLRDTPRSRRFYIKSGFTESGATRLYDFGDGNPLDQLEYLRTCA